MIGEEVRRRREELGLTGAQLAERAGMAPSAVSQIETGKRNPSSTSVVKLAEALGAEVGELFPKAQAPFPFDAPDEDVAERRPDELMVQRPSSAERIWFIEKAVDILRHYYELGQRELSRMREDLTEHGTSYVWYGYYFNSLQPAVERDGLLLHASYVVDGPAQVSERERVACEKLRDFDAKMQYLVWEMREVDDENNARVREEVSRGVTHAQEWLEGDSAGVAMHREESPAAGTSDLEVYVRVANTQATRWEQEIDARIESAQDDHVAFFVWSAEVIGSILALRNSVIPKGLPFPRDPVSDPLLENEAVMAAWEADYRERQLIRKIRNAKRQHLPGQDEIDHQLRELLEQPEPAIVRSDD